MAATSSSDEEIARRERREQYERALEAVLVQVDGTVLRNYGTDEHVVILDPSTATLDHDLLDPERVVVMEVSDV